MLASGGGRGAVLRFTAFRFNFNTGCPNHGESARCAYEIRLLMDCGRLRVLVAEAADAGREEDGPERRGEREVGEAPRSVSSAHGGADPSVSASPGPPLTPV